MSEVQDPAPTPPEIQDVAPPGDTPPEQTDAVVVTELPKQVSILNLIYQWQMAGMRVVISLPSLTNNFDPLFLIRANPLCMNPAVWEWYFTGAVSKKQLAYIQTSFLPIIQNAAGVTTTYYGAPPLLAYLALIHRKWTGGLEFSLRTTASFANQGNVVMTPIYGAIQPRHFYAPQSTNPTTRRMDIAGTGSYKQAMFNSYIQGDTTGDKHLICRVPYRHPIPWQDTFQTLAEHLTMDVNDKGEESIPLVYQGNCTETFVAVANLNQINAVNATGSNQIIYELFVRASEDFKFADRHLQRDFWNIPHETRSNSHTIVIPNAKFDGVAGDPFVKGLP